MRYTRNLEMNAIERSAWRAETDHMIDRLLEHRLPKGDDVLDGPWRPSLLPEEKSRAATRKVDRDKD